MDKQYIVSACPTMVVAQRTVEALESTLRDRTLHASGGTLSKQGLLRIQVVLAAALVVVSQDLQARMGLGPAAAPPR